MTITATATTLPSGKVRYSVLENGVEVESMDSKVTDYSFVNVQRWEGREEQAYRFSRKPKAIGSKIEYGRCVANVEIERA